MTINISEAISTELKPFQVQAPLIGVEWANEYFYISPEYLGTERLAQKGKSVMPSVISS